MISRSNSPEVFLGKGILKICSKCTGEHPCRSVISIKLQSNFIEITFRNGCSAVNLLHSFKTLFLKNMSGELLLDKRDAFPFSIVCMPHLDSNIPGNTYSASIVSEIFGFVRTTSNSSTFTTLFENILKIM